MWIIPFREPPPFVAARSFFAAYITKVARPMADGWPIRLSSLSYLLTIEALRPRSRCCRCCCRCYWCNVNGSIHDTDMEPIWQCGLFFLRWSFNFFQLLESKHSYLDRKSIRLLDFYAVSVPFCQKKRSFPRLTFCLLSTCGAKTHSSHMLPYLPELRDTYISCCWPPSSN